MASVAEAKFPCLGLEFLGSCNYDPTHPATIYFGIGEAVAALGLVVAILQFLKPIYQFRLNVYGIRPSYTLIPFFIGFAFILVAAILPSLPISGVSSWQYPIAWELLGGITYALAFAFITFIAVVPARVRAWTLRSFVLAGGHLLSKAEDNERVDFAYEILAHNNFERLIRFASIFRHVEHHEFSVERERLSQIGASTFIRGYPPACAFTRFAHRRSLLDGAHARELLLLISDKLFCSTLVRKCPWLVARAMRQVSQKNVHDNVANSFVQEVAYQAIMLDDSMLAREVGYGGFGAVPLLLESLFSDTFILRTYNPFGALFYSGMGVTAEQLRRFNSAAKAAFVALIDSGEIYHTTAAHHIAGFYESAFMTAYKMQKEEEPDSQFAFEMHEAVKLAIDMSDRMLARQTDEEFRWLYAAEDDSSRSDLLDVFTRIVFDSLCKIANNFKGHDDPFWMTGMEPFRTVYPVFGEQPAGMTPFQQRLAIMLMKKLDDNMDGFYPAICRILLACVGPYDDRTQAPSGSAFGILKRAMYFRLQRLSELAAKRPEKVAEYLPENVHYDNTTGILSHVNRGGGAVETNLRQLNLEAVDLMSDAIKGLIPRPA